MLISYTNGQTSVILRVKIRNSSVSTGAGLTGLTNASTGLIISTIADNESSPTVYTVAASHVQTITTLGTYAAPSASNCRFGEVQATDHPGIYEIQIADARFAVSNAKSLLVSLSGATNMAECDAVIPLQGVNPYDAVHGGMSAIPNTAVTTNASLLTSGTGTDQLSVASGRIDIGKALGTAVTLDSNNVLNVSTKYLGGTLQTARDIGASVLLSNGTGTGQVVLSSGVVGSNLLALQSQQVATTGAGTITFQAAATIASTTNITAGTITTATNLTNAATSGDFTATMKTSLNSSTPQANVATWLSHAVTVDANNAPNVNTKYWAAVATFNSSDTLPAVHTSNLVTANVTEIKGDGGAADILNQTFSSSESAVGSLSFGIVPTQGDTVTIPNGVTSVTYTFTTTPSLPTDIDISSGNTSTIAGLIGTAITGSALNINVGVSGSLVNLGNNVAGTAGNVLITQTGTMGIGLGGFSGGTDAGWGINFSVSAGSQTLNTDASISGGVNVAKWAGTNVSAATAGIPNVNAIAINNQPTSAAGSITFPSSIASAAAVATIQTCLSGIISGATVVNANTASGAAIAPASTAVSNVNYTAGLATALGTTNTSVANIVAGTDVIRANNATGGTIPTVAQIDAQLTGTHGSGAWGVAALVNGTVATVASSTQFTFTTSNTLNPDPGLVGMWVQFNGNVTTALNGIPFEIATFTASSLTITLSTTPGVIPQAGDTFQIFGRVAA
jgi:hypothetical protein